MFVEVIIEVDLQSVAQATQAGQRHVEQVLNEGMDAVLDGVELIQVHKYLSDAFPARPPESTYTRTFALRSASRKERTGRQLPSIGGVWYIDEGAAPHAPYVIGPKAIQAEIHRGRWLSQEEIEAEAQQRAPAIMQEVVDRYEISV